jgi:predicted ATPase
MRIQTIEANNFKSLVELRLDLSKFTCLIGLNGAGKSTVLQFIDFLSQQMQGDIEGWLTERNWRARDMKSRLTTKKNIDFSVDLTSGEFMDPGEWKASFNPGQLHCTQERISFGNAYLIVSGNTVRFGETSPGIEKSFTQRITFEYQGSILSQLKESTLPAPLVELKKFFLNVKSLDLLSPEYLRRRTRESAGSLGRGGQKLSAFLHELGERKRRQLIEQLRKAYPQIVDVRTKSLRSGWKQLEVTEAYQGEQTGFFPLMTTEARHVADGMLRLIAILSEIQTDHRFLLFDEIENGINPELVEFVLDTLASAPQQVLVTTHSPLILNYLEDEVAKEGVVYLYKTRNGRTQATRFFEIPSVAEKLTVMGPGEAFADTDLTALQDEIEVVAES